LEETLFYLLNLSFKDSSPLMNKLAFQIILIVAGCTLFACNKADDPVKEDVPEMVTQAIFTFTPETGTPVVVTATDPDGVGFEDLETDGAANLVANIPYNLTITLSNTLLPEGDPGYDITAEVQEEGDEHLFFYSWTNDVFSSPVGNGNIDNRSDEVEYVDYDLHNLPVGLETRWIAQSSKTGNLRILLKHQPDLKSQTSSASDGETDLDITLEIVVN
jgi:hypothetical protein